MKPSSPIILFVLASTVVHAGFMMNSNNTSTITLPGSTGSVMAVRIKEKTTQQHDNNKPESVSKKTASPKLTKLISSEKYIKIPRNKQVNKTASTPATSSSDNSRAHVISILIDEFSRYFSYPKLAQRRNWQGKVLLSLRISPAGLIKSIEINDSSGYSILDQAALAAMRKVGTLPKISSWLKNDIELQLPVVYQLTES